METLKLQIGGMHCAACVRRITAALGKLPGVEVESVEIGAAHVRYEPAAIAPERIVNAIEQIGFNASRS